MAKLEVDIGDDGKIGTLPPELQQFFDKGFNEAYAKGAAKKAEEMKPHVADPVERERLKQLEEENQKFKLSEAEREKRYEDALKMRDDKHAKDLSERDEKIKVREGKIRKAVDARIEAAAVKAGARDESLAELVKILGGDIDLDADLEPFVKGSDGKPAVDKDKKPIDIEGHVKAYLESHAHHRKAQGGKGGGAPGGRAFRETGGTGNADKDEAFAAVAESPSVTNVARAMRHIGKSA